MAKSVYERAIFFSRERPAELAAIIEALNRPVALGSDITIQDANCATGTTYDSVSPATGTVDLAYNNLPFTATVTWQAANATTPAYVYSTAGTYVREGTLSNLPASVTNAGGYKVKQTIKLAGTYTKSNKTDFTSYSVKSGTTTYTGTVNTTAHTIAISVPSGTAVAALVATFKLDRLATCKVGSTAQVSGTTANDFTSAVTYTVTAEDGTTTQAWTVTVTVAS